MRVVLKNTPSSDMLWVEGIRAGLIHFTYTLFTPDSFCVPHP